LRLEPKPARKKAPKRPSKTYWPVELGQELEKSRGVERQELRFKSYGELWKKLRPLAIYSDKPVNRANFGELTEDLSDWYFSECGGMFLLPHVRDFYFALQVSPEP
jgi:hypothetical protein